MNLLDKFNKVEVDNSTRICNKLYTELKEYEKTKLGQIDIHNKDMSYLSAYKDGKPFQKSIEDVNNRIHGCYYDIAQNTFDKINSHYNLKTWYRDYSPENRNHNVDDIIDYFFNKNGNIDLGNASKELVKSNFFDMFNRTNRKLIPSVAKNGTLTLTKVIYIDSYYSYYTEALKIDYSTDWKMETLDKAFSLFMNDKVDSSGVVKELEYHDNDGKKQNNYYKKGKTDIGVCGVKSITFYANGNMKVVFDDPTDGLKFFNYFNLGQCETY